MTNFNLQRFVDAQDPCYQQVLKELKAGRKTTHWMWFVFPQIAGLGHSSMAQKYAITSLAEAKAFLEHPVLGKRYKECLAILLSQPKTDPHSIFGFPDDLKFHSSLTLFKQVNIHSSSINRTIDKFFDGSVDQKSVDLLYD